MIVCTCFVILCNVFAFKIVQFIYGLFFTSLRIQMLAFPFCTQLTYEFLILLHLSYLVQIAICFDSLYIGKCIYFLCFHYTAIHSCKMVNYSLHINGNLSFVFIDKVRNFFRHPFSKECTWLDKSVTFLSFIPESKISEIASLHFIASKICL